MTRDSQQQLRMHRLRARLLFTVSAVVLLLAAWVVIGRQLMLRVPDYRPQLEALVEQRINTPLEIESMSGYMDGAVPVFVFENVRLPAQEGTAPLQIGRVELSVDVLASLASRNLRARQLLISGIDLRLTMEQGGKVRLTGLDALGSASGAQRKAPLNALLDLIYRQKRLVVEDARGELILPDMPPVRVRDLAIAIVSSGSTHRVALRAQHADRPVSMDVRVVVEGDPHTLAEIRGDAYVHLDVDEVVPWVNAVLPASWQISALRGDMEAWLSLDRGAVRSASLALDLEELALAADVLDGTLALGNAAATASLSRQSSGYQLQLADLRATHAGNELQWPRLALRWDGVRDAQSQWQLASRDLQLTNVRRLFAGLPIHWPASAQALRQKLDQLQPGGTLESISLSGQGRTPTAFSARFVDLDITAHEKIPGVSGLSGWLAGDAQQGVVMLQSPLLELDLPLLFHAPLSVQAQGPLRWYRHDLETRIDVGWLEAQNTHARGQAAAVVRLLPDRIPELSLLASISDGEAREAHRYIPLRKLPEPVADWLSEAFVAGQAKRGVILHEGPVRIDPERQQDRTLQVGINARNLTLHFLPDWPNITQLSAEVVVDGREIRGRHVSGRIFNSRLDQATVDIPEYEGEQAPVLIINSGLQGPASDVQALLQQTPLANALPQELQQWAMPVGSVRGHALLNIPLRKDAGDMVVLAQAEAQSVSLENTGRRLALSEVQGPVSFSLDQGIQAPALTAKLWQQPVLASVRSVDRKTRIEFQGNTSVASVRDWLQAPWLAPATGELLYQAELVMPAADADVLLTVDADASSVEVDLPAPLGKRRGELDALALRFSSIDGQQDVQLDHAGLVSAMLRLREGELERGNIQLGSGKARLPRVEGITVGGQVAHLVVRDWVDYFSSDALPATGDGAFPLRELVLNVTRANIYDLDVTEAQLRVTPGENDWRFAVDSSTLAAALTLPDGYSARGAVPMTLDVQQIVVQTAAPNAGKEAGALLDIDPLQVPTLRASIQSAVVDDEDYGRWSFLVKPTQRGVALTELVGDIRGARVTGTLDWEKAAQAQSHFIGRVESDNVGRLLKLWGFAPVLESDDLTALLDVRWPGSPLDIDYLALQGKTSIELGESRFPKTDSKTSALRVLGVFNITTVGRRLRFDFTDLYKKGMSCDSIGGDFAINGALLTTQNLVIKSPSAEFRVKGEVNLETETLDNSVEVTLPVSSNLYVGCLAGPAACAGIFVVERLWGDRLEKMTTLGYRVTGSWDNPDVKEIQGLFENSK